MSASPTAPLIVVLGGTGTAGRAVVAEALARGARVRAVGRARPAPGRLPRGAEFAAADIVTGVGLVGALNGAAAIVDATNGVARAPRRTLTAGPAIVARAARLNHVHRLVLLSIINVDRSEAGYYRAKAAQERAYLAGRLDVTVVRASQFHDFVDSLAGSLPLGLTAAIVGARLQPIAVTDVARILVTEALVPAAGARTITAAGPEILDGREIASLHRSAPGRGHGAIVPIPVPGAFGMFFRSGLATKSVSTPGSPSGTLSYAEWLTGDVGGPAYSDGMTNATATWATTLAVFDLETTGIDVENCRIVTATLAVLDADGVVASRTDWLVDPGIEIPEPATNVHGITTEHARVYGRVAAEAVNEIVEAVREQLSAGVPLVAYNAAYDLTVLNREAIRYGIAPLESPSPVIDPLVIDKAVDRYRKGKRTLTAAAEHYGVVLDNAHDAGADAIAAGHIAQAIAARYALQLALTLDELHARQIVWSRESAESFQDYMRRTKDPTFTTSGAWPER